MFDSGKVKPDAGVVDCSAVVGNEALIVAEAIAVVDNIESRKLCCSSELREGMGKGRSILGWLIAGPAYK